MNKARIKIDKVIGSCQICPFCERDEYYDCSIDSGWNCKATGRRIMSDGEFERFCKKQGEEIDNMFIPIPDWCPFIEEQRRKEE